jgi:hypothetical protein
MARVNQRLQRRNGELRGAEVQDSKGYHLPSRRSF